MIVITSAAFVADALASEFGHIPPVMLPVQNKRLYEHQLSIIPDDEEVFLTLPVNYVVPSYDVARLSSKGVHIIMVSEEKSLGESILYTLEYIGKNNTVTILHGDTLFSELPTSDDTYSVSEPKDYYRWTYSTDEVTKVYSGCFSFSSSYDLIECLKITGGEFIKSIEKYKSIHHVKEIELKGWLDFGLVNTYYRSCSELTTQRVFNSLAMNRYSVHKSSTDKQKIAAEVQWLLSVPKEMKHYVPALWDYGVSGERGFYEIEHLYLSSLASIYVFGINSTFVWRRIIDSCVEFIENEFQIKPLDIGHVAKENASLYSQKTYLRLQQYCEVNSISMDRQWIYNGLELPSLNIILKDILSRFKGDDAVFVSMMHGDFCFSNILYDFKSRNIKTIDPRGITLDGEITLYGDIRYDVAKLAHSVIGLYDFIISGRFRYEEVEPYNLSFSIDCDGGVYEVQDYFASLSIAGYSLSQLSVIPITILLFLSMLPLHYDNPLRQKALFANALRLYCMLIKN